MSGPLGRVTSVVAKERKGRVIFIHTIKIHTKKYHRKSYFYLLTFREIEKGSLIKILIPSEVPSIQVYVPWNCLEYSLPIGNTGVDWQGKICLFRKVLTG
jgi:hypothetical protein